MKIDRLIAIFLHLAFTLADAFTSEQQQQQVLEEGEPEFAAYLDVRPFDAAPPSQGEPFGNERRDWSVTCDTFEAPSDCKTFLNKDLKSPWRSGADNWPHFLTVDLKQKVLVTGISMRPLRIDFTGNIAVHEVYVSNDGLNWSQPVAYGTWWGDNTEKFANFEPVQAQFVRLTARSTALGDNFTTISDFNVFRLDAAPPALPDPAVGGQWGPTVDFPIVPAGAWVDPITGRVVTYSSYGHDRFDDATDPRIPGRTLTATWDPTTKQVSQRIVDETKHDMFCPGMSFDATGQLIVTGGRTNTRTSIYANGGWTRSAEMMMKRGYQSSATCSDGRIFVIGGSWESVDGQLGSPGCLPKDGEIYDPITKRWAMLPGALVRPMWTAEEGQFANCPMFRRDNHGWLFPWKRNKIFQAGPSKAMNWYSTSGAGSVVAAGTRSDDDDAMCGIAVMYDAVKGKILTAGGSKTYGDQSFPSTTNAYILTIDDSSINATVSSVKIKSMAAPRMYHSGVLLPNGQTFVVGGRMVGGIFVDRQAVLEPELFTPTSNPADGIWTKMARHSTPRTYHSFALLLPDASILVGGGGLCVPGWSCNEKPAVNHFDAQLFFPPYLFNKSGGLAARPYIVSQDLPSVRLNDSFVVETNTAISSASLIRYGSATHGLNTDQRRIPIAPVQIGTTTRYNITIPAAPGVAIPGYWMLFVMNADGVPSKAKNVLINL